MRNKQIKKAFFCIFAVSMAMVSLSYAQQSSSQKEEIVITTYYPVPYGDYQKLRLFPSEQPTNSCDVDTAGLLYYDEANNQVMVCRLISLGNYRWQPVGLWSQSGNNLYADDIGWNTGIGTTVARAYDNRQTKLDVGDNVQGNHDGYIAVDDVYVKNPVSGQAPGWLSQGGDLAVPVNGQCPAGYSRLNISTQTGPVQMGGYAWNVCYYMFSSTSTTFLCVKNGKIGTESGTMDQGVQCFYP